jgi:hypothetical protein
MSVASDVFLRIRDGNSGSDVATASVGCLCTGLVEDREYHLSIVGVQVYAIFVDDIALTSAGQEAFRWSAGFFAGQVSVVVRESVGTEHEFILEVCPTERKVAATHFEAMVEEIRRFDVALLLGDFGITSLFGEGGATTRFEMHIRWARMKRHLPAFIKATKDLARTEQRFLKGVERAESLARAKRIPEASCLDRRIVALAAGNALPDQELEAIRIWTQVPSYSLDTPANRTMLALLNRVALALATISKWAAAPTDGIDREAHAARRTRRNEQIRDFTEEIRTLRRSHPFDAVSKAEMTSGGLTQIAAHPSYRRAHRLGVDSLKRGFASTRRKSQIGVIPTWGVYETWCFLTVSQLVEQILGQHLARVRKSALASADVALSAQCGLVTVEVLFQPVFPAQDTVSRSLCWSISQERVPDVGVVVTTNGTRRYMLFDAKYRSGRDNTLKAMSSAHIYHDSLRVAQNATSDLAPEACLLLLPGPPHVAMLETPDYRNRQKVGAISHFSISAAGIEVCKQVLREWLTGIIGAAALGQPVDGHVTPAHDLGTQWATTNGAVTSEPPLATNKVTF